MAYLHFWYYQNPAKFKEAQEGPLTEKVLLTLADSGEISEDSKVMSPTATEGRWVEATRVSVVAERIKLKIQNTRVRTADDGSEMEYEVRTWRDNAVPVFVNFIFPGVGQILQGRHKTGGLIVLCWLCAIASIFLVFGIIWAPICWMVALVDAASYRTI